MGTVKKIQFIRYKTSDHDSSSGSSALK